MSSVHESKSESKKFKRTLTQGQKQAVAASQSYQCKNRPFSNLPGIGDYLCPLWQRTGPARGNFDKSGYEVDHIAQHSETGDDRRENLQALCKMCHGTKTAQAAHKPFAVKSAPAVLISPPLTVPTFESVYPKLT